MKQAEDAARDLPMAERGWRFGEKGPRDQLVSLFVVGHGQEVIRGQEPPSSQGFHGGIIRRRKRRVHARRTDSWVRVSRMERIRSSGRRASLPPVRSAHGPFLAGARPAPE